MQRKHIKIYVIVQGVGFRFYTQRIAHKFKITGTVQNIEDYVDIYAQGNEEQLNQFIASVTTGASHVDDYEIETLEIDNQLKEFKTI